MAEQLQAIQRRIKSIESTEKITNAMQLVASAKLKQATNRYNYSIDHLMPMSDKFRHVLAAFPQVYEIAKEALGNPVLTLIITGSKGMCGSYNSVIIKEMESLDKDVSRVYLPIGSKAYDYIRFQGLPLYEISIKETNPVTIRDFHTLPPEEHPYSNVRFLGRALINALVHKEISGIDLIHAVYLNSISYRPDHEKLFPFPEMLAEDSKSIASVKESEVKEFDHNYIRNLAAEYLAMRLYRAISEATLCEYGARRMAMKNASDSAEEMLSDLEMKYHRARQADITDELIEIISGTESQRSIEERAQEDRIWIKSKEHYIE